MLDIRKCFQYFFFIVFFLFALNSYSQTDSISVIRIDSLQFTKNLVDSIPAIVKDSLRSGLVADSLKTIRTLNQNKDILPGQTGKIAGKIIDKENGEEIIGATVIAKSLNDTVGTVTDLEGKYFMEAKPGKYSLSIQYLGYNTLEYKDIVVVEKETTHINGAIETSAGQLEEVVIQGELRKNTTEALYVQQRNAITNQSGITADQFRKLPDRTTADILKRVSGASIQDNKFAVIRGLNDRYNMAMVNGLPMPSTESDRKAFSFDLIPSNLLDNMVIVKTATPDLPGDFAGGIIQINTIDIPDDNRQSLSIGGQVHSITTFKPGLRESNPSGNFLGGNVRGGFPNSLGEMKDYSKVPFSEVAPNSKQFDNNYVPKKISSTRPNLSLLYTLARRYKIAHNPFGVLLGLNYNNNIRYTSGVINLFDAPGGGSTEGRFYDQNNIYRTQTLAGGILNFSYRVGQNTKFTFKNLYNVNSDSYVATRSGKFIQSSSDPSSNKLYSDTAYLFSTNKMYSGQFAGEHVFEKSKIKIKGIAGLNLINRAVPNYKKITYGSNYDVVADDGSFKRPVLDVQQTLGLFANTGGMYFSKLNENSENFALDFTLPAKLIRTEFKVGTFNQNRKRDFEFLALCYQNPDNVPVNLSSSTAAFTDKNFDNKAIGLTFSDYNSYHATSTLNAFYGMADTRFNGLFRLIYGARFEYFNQNVLTNSVKTPSIIKNGDLLPSLTFIYSLNTRMNIKLAASKTLSRPEFREVSPVQFYDFNSATIIEGNPFLKRSQIYNFDLKYEFYPTAGETFSVSPFYKKFVDPIETVIETGNNIRKFNYVNQASATCYGVEIEARKKFLTNFVVFINYARIKSVVQSVDPQDKNVNRPLQGQSPYIVNGGLQYNNEKYLFNTSLTINRVGNRIAYQNSIPNQMIWEKARTIIDFQFSKTLYKKFEVRYVLGDMLSQAWIFFNDLDADRQFKSDKDVIVYSYRMGQTHTFSVNYKF